MSSKDYIIGNTSIILSNAPFIYVCASLNDISKVEDSSDNLGVWYYVIIGTSILIVIIVIIVVYYLAKRELRKTLEEIQQRKEKEKQDLENRMQSGRQDQVSPNQDDSLVDSDTPASAHAQEV